MSLTRSAATLLVLACALSVGGCDGDKGTASKRSSEPQTRERGKVAEHAPGEQSTAAHDEAEHGEHEEGQVTLAPAVQERIGLKTAPVQSQAFSAELAATGEVDFDRNRLAHVSPRLAGRVTDVKANLGDEVKKGDWLAAIDSIELGQAKAAYLTASARADVTRRAFEREQKLFEEKISPEREMLEARADWLAARSELNAASETLRLYGLTKRDIENIRFGDPQASIVPLRAPIAGRVVEKHVTQGELVTPEKNLFSIADLSTLWVWTDIFERDLAKVHLGDEVAITTESLPGKVFNGTIGYIEDQVDREARTVRARIDVANDARQLKPGMFVRVRISDPHADAGAAQEQALVLPSAALVREGNDTFVFVQEAPGVFEQRKVRAGRMAGDLVEILSGLEPSDTVVTDGVFFLKSEVKRDQLAEGGHSH